MCSLVILFSILSSHFSTFFPTTILTWKIWTYHLFRNVSFTLEVLWWVYKNRSLNFMGFLNPLQFSNQIYNSFIKSNQIKCWLLRRGENWSTRRKTSRSRVENQQTQPTYDAESGNWTRDTLVEGEHSHRCANPALQLRQSLVLQCSDIFTSQNG